MFEIPEDVRFVIGALEAAGHEAFVVGGCVRDLLRGVAPVDWDFATSALPAEVKALFSRTFDTGIKHGTVTVLHGAAQFEVTTYRTDGEYLDSRRPESVTFSGKIEDDLSRRDFTVNAIAYSPARGFVDPFGGRADIERRVIRCVGAAEKRFGEDALRMLRAVRFSATLGFSVDAKALQAAKTHAHDLANISAERVREEFVKLLCGKNLSALSLLKFTGLLYFVLQKRGFFGDLDAKISQLAALGETADETMRVALFLADEPDFSGILRDLKFDNKSVKIISMYLRFLFEEIPLSRYEIKKILRIVPFENFEKLLALKKILGNETREILTEARDILAKNECFTLSGLAVNGDDLAAAGFCGKAIGDELERLLDAVMREPELNSRERLL